MIIWVRIQEHKNVISKQREDRADREQAAE